MGIVTTSIRVDSDLWKKFKIQTVRNEITVTDALNELIKRYPK